MAVIINDLEVVVGTEEARPPDEAERARAAPPLRPEDINDIVERHMRLLARVAAH